MLYLFVPLGGWAWQEMQLMVGVSIAPLRWPGCVPDVAPEPWQPSQLVSVVWVTPFRVKVGGVLWQSPHATLRVPQVGEVLGSFVGFGL